MNNKPEIVQFSDGGFAWELSFETFCMKMYVPQSKLPWKIINYGFRAPYLLIFKDDLRDLNAVKEYADKVGFAQIAAGYACGVAVVSPLPGVTWENAPETIYQDVIAQSRISQYYEDGFALMWDRFAKKWGEYFIRGTVSRAMLYGQGKAADYIAKNYLKTVEGQGMFGPGDITPAACVLENLSVEVVPERRDIPVLSIGNSCTVNRLFAEALDHFESKDSADYVKDFEEFTGNFRRMVGNLMEEPDFEKLGMIAKPGILKVTTSEDNRGDDKDTAEHEIGFMAFCNKSALESGKKLPLVMCYHGGGDSIFYMSIISGWYRVAHDHNFLLVCVENHLNSTATEMMTLMNHVAELYPVDKEKMYATGFSMGGCKSWDMYQEYPEVFAGLAPMDATFEVGLNVFGQPAPKEINQDVVVPVFYAGGEITPLPELPFQEKKCTDRMAYVLKVNKAKTPYNVDFAKQEDWTNPIWGIDGDYVTKHVDGSRGNAVLTLHYFVSEDNKCYSVFGSISGQGHEVRHHTCEQAWRFLSRFRRLANGELVEESKNEPWRCESNN